jgi:hypothetical protein
VVLLFSTRQAYVLEVEWFIKAAVASTHANIISYLPGDTSGIFVVSLKKSRVSSALRILCRLVRSIIGLLLTIVLAVCKPHGIAFLLPVHLAFDEIV